MFFVFLFFLDVPINLMSHKVSFCDDHVSTWPQLFHSCEIYRKRKVIYTYLIDISNFFQTVPHIQKGNEGFVHHMLLFECEGNFTEEHFNKGVNCYDRANMPFLKCKSSSIVAGWAVGAMVRTLIHFNLNRTFISICVDFMVKFSRNKDQNTVWEMRLPMGERVEKRLAVITFCVDFPRVANSNNYSQSPLYRRHSLNKETSLLRTVCIVPWEKSLCIFSKFNPLNTDTFYDPHSVRFNGVWLCYLSFPT